MYQDYSVKLTFNDGGGDHDLPYVQNISDPVPGMKANVIRGIRADGSIVIKGGKKSVDIDVKGILWSNDGYVDLMTKQGELRTNITTLPATLTLQYYDPNASGGGQWITSWSFAVIRTEDITFGTSMRTESLEYNVKFLITSF
jgi:hypothetical protein